MVFAIIAAMLPLLSLAGFAAVYVHHRRQTEHAILRNFPVIAAPGIAWPG